MFTSIKNALNAKQYKFEIEGLIEENKRLKLIKLTPTQMELSQILSKTKELEMESERYNELIETKTKAIKDLSIEYSNQALYQAQEFEQKSKQYFQKSNEYNNIIDLKGKDLEDHSADYDNLIETKGKEYKDLIDLKSNELKQKSNEYKLLIETKTKSIEDLDLEYTNVKTCVDNLKSQIITLDDDILMQNFGIYKPEYDLISLEECTTMLQDIRKRQMDMIKSREAIEFKQWTINGNIKEDNQIVDSMTQDMIKLVIRIFNDECDSIINKVELNNIEVIENLIKEFFEDLNKLGSITQVKIVPNYLNIKLEELHLSYECKLKKQSKINNVVEPANN
jgi:hypothetical protein